MSKRHQVLVNNPEEALGKQVYKPSGKPFKSGNKFNTVKAITTNPNTGKKAFTFIEDDSVVDVCQCEKQMNNLFLVTRDGERHEDHVPEGFFDFETLCKRYMPQKITEKALSDGKWHQVDVLSDDYEWDEEDIKNFFKNNIQPILTKLGISDNDFYEYVRKINIVLIQANRCVDQT